MNSRSRTACAVLIAAALMVWGAACGDGGPAPNDPDSWHQDTGSGRDPGTWDPGTPGNGCGGYGYGTGPDCVPEGALDCTQDPCIFGTCVVVAGSGLCECQEGYAGRICGECAEGFVARGLRCARRDACDTFPCVFGTCRILNAQPVCDCDGGYTGENCDRCADGYRPQDLRCVKEDE